MRLLFRGRKFDDEFLPDYLQRMSSNNGFNDVGRFKKALKDYYKLRNGKHHRLRNQAVCRVSLELVLERNIPVDEYNRYYAVKRGEWQRKSKLCKSCWEEKQYYRFYWRLKGYVECHIHHDGLIYDSLASDEGRSDEWGVLSSSLIHFIVEKYIDAELCQKKILEELDASLGDRKIISGIRRYFEFDERVLLASEVAVEAISSGELVGLAPEERLKIIADILSGFVGSKEFWFRVLELSVLSNDRGLYLGLSRSAFNGELVKACRYSLSVDSHFDRLFGVIKNFKEYSEMNKVSIQDFLCDDLQFPGHIVDLIKSSLFFSRNILTQSSKKQNHISPVWNILPKSMDSSAFREF